MAAEAGQCRQRCAADCQPLFDAENGGSDAVVEGRIYSTHFRSGLATVAGLEPGDRGLRGHRRAAEWQVAGKCGVREDQP